MSVGGKSLRSFVLCPRRNSDASGASNGVPSPDRSGALDGVGSSGRRGPGRGRSRPRSSSDRCFPRSFSGRAPMCELQDAERNMAVAMDRSEVRFAERPGQKTKGNVRLAGDDVLGTSIGPDYRLRRRFDFGLSSSDFGLSSSDFSAGFPPSSVARCWA